MRKVWFRSIVMAAAFAMLAMAAHAAGPLFGPLDQTAAYRQALGLDRSYLALADSPATASLQLVRVHTDAVTLKTDSLDLNLAPGLDLRAHRVDSHVTSSGSLAWSGVIELPSSVRTPFSADTVQFDPIDSVVLIKNGDRVTGNVHFQGTWYKIRPLRTGGHAITEVNVNAMPADHPPAYEKLPVRRMKGGQPGSGLDKVNTVIRVLVNYTAAAAAASGDINALIDLAVVETNLGYTNSGVQITMELANKSQTAYNESGNFSTDLARYRTVGDGYMDEIHTTRNTTAADVGVLIINNTQYCGLASGIGSTAATAFAAAYWDCITGYYSFGHEIGHLQSARHDPKNDPSTTPYAWGHGYQYTKTPSWRTIMAYNCSGLGCPRLNFWSNPNNLYNGKPMGTTTKNDNTRVLNDTRATVAAFR